MDELGLLYRHIKTDDSDAKCMHEGYNGTRATHIQKAELCSNGTLHTNCLQHYYILTIMVYCDCNFGMSLPIKFHRGKAKWLFEKMFSKNLFTTRSV